MKKFPLPTLLAVFSAATSFAQTDYSPRERERSKGDFRPKYVNAAFVWQKIYNKTDESKYLPPDYRAKINSGGGRVCPGFRF